GISAAALTGVTGRPPFEEVSMNLRAVDTKLPVRSAPPPATANPPAHRRNPGFPLDLDWLGRVRMNRSALERRAATIGARRTVKKDYQLAWLLKAITLIDLTRSEEHTSELQSRENLVCRLLLEKKKKVKKFKKD